MNLSNSQNRSRASNLKYLLAPRSIAIVGASSNAEKLSGRVLAYLQRHNFKGKIWPVNPAQSSIGDLTCYADAAALPAAPDLGVVALSPQASVKAVETLAARGARSCAVLSSGFAEVGKEGAALEQRMAQITEAHDMALLGPNCLGFFNAFDNTFSTFSQYAGGKASAGPVAFVSQSGAFGTAVAGLARQKGIGLGWFVNTGNEAALDVWDVLEAAVDDTRIEVLAAYVESMGNGRKMVRLARRAAKAGKPLVLAKVGNSAQGAKAAAAHTGALATPARIYQGVATQLGVISVADEREMLNVIEALLRAGRIRGHRIGVVTMSGGAGVQMADLAESLGAPLPDLGENTRNKLKPLVPEFASLNNPVDVTAQFIAKPEILENAVATLQSDPELDCIILWLQMMDGFGDRIAEGISKCQGTSSVPLLVTWVAANAGTRKALHNHGLATFDSGADAVRAAVAMARSSNAIALLEDEPFPSLSDDRPKSARVLATGAAAEMLAGCGVPLARSVAVNSAEDAARAVDGDQAYAFKIISPDIAHKSDIGGVRLGVEGKDVAKEVFDDLMASAKAAHPDARLDGVEVQPMAPHGVELVFGYSHHPSLGPVVMLGHGGIFVELVGGAQFGVAPVGARQAEAMLDALPAQDLLDGARGRPPVDRKALAQSFADFSNHVSLHSDALAEVDLNPIIATKDGFIAVDWLVSAAAKETEQ
ncbi:MAG: acetate--CoA ligase family protein [Roseovarius sp.]|nr:acetate--CoA ligase family protein [Roseovarius sp.]